MNVVMVISMLISVVVVLVLRQSVVPHDGHRMPNESKTKGSNKEGWRAKQGMEQAVKIGRFVGGTRTGTYYSGFFPPIIASCGLAAQHQDKED